MKTVRWALALTSLAVLASCGPNIPTVARPIPVSTVYDPSTSNIPSPNDLALDAKGIVDISVNPVLSDAENDLKRSFNGKKGFSAGSSARVTFGAPLSAASINEGSVVAFDLGLNRAGPVTAVKVNRAYTDCDRAVTMTSPTGFVPGHTYLFAVRGGDAGVRGVHDEEVVESPAFHYLRAGKDLREHADALPGATRDERAASAAKLEGVRQQLEPLFQILETQKLPRREVVALWHFTVHTQGELYFDPGTKQLPFPNDLLKDPATGLVAIPIDPTEKPESQALKKSFNTLNGFALTASLYFNSTTAIDRTSVSATTVRLFERDTGKEFTDLSRVVSVDAKKLVLTPLSPLSPATTYVVVVNGLKDSKANTFSSMPLSAALSLGKPLVDDAGKSVVSSFCTETAVRLEGMRSGIAKVLSDAKLPVTGPAFDAAGKANPLPSLTYQFTTQDIMKRTREAWLTPYDKQLPLTVRDLTSQSGAILPVLNGLSSGIIPKTDKIYAGKFATWDRLDPTTRAFRDNGAGVQRDITFILTVPKGATSKTKIAVFGHGLYTEKRLVYFIAEALADKGYAAMAIDFPYHGDRTVCLKETHFIVPIPMCPNGATCSDDGHCIKDGMEVPLVQADIFQLMAQILGAPVPPLQLAGLNIPAGTGQPWIDVENLGGTRDHFRQAMIDLSAQTRLIKGANWPSILGGVGFDSDHIYWTGVSLGGIMGSVVSSVDPAYKAMLLNVPGGDLPNLMLESNMFRGTLVDGLKAKGIVEGSAEWDSFLGAAHWLLDEIDPINIIPYAKAGGWKTVNPATLELSPAPPKRLRVHMALNDVVVPNSSTAALVKAGKINKDTEYREFIGSHGFLFDPIEVVPRLQGLSDMVDFLDGKK